MLGCLIFIDDYFNCLTVGSVMRPITDRHHVSRAKLAYIIDATAAPVCIIAPISSWAAAVSGFAEDGQGLTLFIRAIPYNFYALLTIVMMLGLVLMKVDFGPMAKFERNAIENNDLFSGSNPYAMLDEEIDDTKGTVMDLVLPIAVLVVCCVIGMIYSGGFFSGTDFVSAFSNSDASVGLMLGSAYAIVNGPASLSTPLPPMNPTSFRWPAFLLGIVLLLAPELLKQAWDRLAALRACTRN